MISGMARSGDSVGGGVIIGTAIKTFLNGRPVARIGDRITPHGHDDDEHQHAVLVSGGSLTVFVEGLPVAKVGSVASCGHVVTTGSPDVEVG